MNFSENWNRALKTTEIIRPRVQSLETFAITSLPYMMLSESSVNLGDTVTRSGEIRIEKPALILPHHSPQFEGFEFGNQADFNTDIWTSLLLVRGVVFPSIKCANKREKIDVFEGSLSKAKSHFLNQLQRKEDVVTTLLLGQADLWQFSLLIFLAGQVARSAEGDVQKIFERYRKTKWF